MTTVVEFLLARIAEEEHPANPLLHLPPERGGEHVARRVLAECAAKRAIVAEHQEEVGYVVVFRESDRLIAEGFDMDSVPLQASAAVIPRCLRHMAAVYADHPDFNPEWTDPWH